MTKMMTGNVQATYELPETESKLYHLRVTKRIMIDSVRMDFEDAQMVIKLSPRDFHKFQDSKQVCGFREEEILHDPTKEEKRPSGRPSKTNSKTENDE